MNKLDLLAAIVPIIALVMLLNIDRIKRIKKRFRNFTNRVLTFINTLVACVIHFFKVRYTARKFNIQTEKIDQDRKSDTQTSGDYIGYDGILYYGHPAFIFFKSAHNDWWSSSRLTTKY